MVEKIKTNFNVQVDWLPFFLHPEIPPGGVAVTPELRANMRGMHTRLAQRAEQDGLPMVFPDVIAYSRTALEATEYAREKDKLDDFHHIVFRKYYGEGQDIGKWEVLRAAAHEAGLDSHEMQRQTESGKYAPIIDQHIQTAVSMGIRGVPTFILDNQHAIVGAQPYPIFEQALEQLGFNPSSRTPDNL